MHPLLLFSFDRTDRVYGECWRSSSGVGLGRGFGCGLVFWLGNPWNGQLFHVEQFGKRRKMPEFCCFLTVRRTDRQAKNTVGGAVFTVEFSPVTVITVFGAKSDFRMPGGSRASRRCRLARRGPLPRPPPLCPERSRGAGAKPKAERTNCIFR